MDLDEAWEIYVDWIQERRNRRPYLEVFDPYSGDIRHALERHREIHATAYGPSPKIVYAITTIHRALPVRRIT